MRSIRLTLPVWLVLIALPLSVWGAFELLSADYHLHRAHRFICVRNYVRAERESQKALDIDPKSANGYYFLGVCKQNQGKPYEAMEYFKKAVVLDPNHATANRWIAVLLRTMGKRQDAGQYHHITQEAFHPKR